MSRSLVVLKPGEKVTYECPPGCRAYGVLVNHSFTNAIIHFKSPVGHTTFDMRFQPQPFDWIASVAPILDPVGGGTIEVSIVDRPPASGNFHCMHGTGTVRDGPMAELGELILVSTDWKEVIPVVEKQAAETLRIEDFSWARGLIADAASSADPVVRSVETEGLFVDNLRSRFVADALAKRTSPLSRADQARLLLVMGLTDQLEKFLHDVCNEGLRNPQVGDPVLEDMRAAL